MTSPTFDLIPVPSRNALANPPPPATTQATTIDTNFSKVNPWLSGHQRAWAWESRHWGSIQYGLLPYWSGMEAWPAIWFTMPDCRWLIITMSCLLDQVPGPDASGGIGIVCTGPGFAGLSPNTPTFHNTTRTTYSGQLQSTSVTGFVSRASLNVGAGAGVLPAYAVNRDPMWIANGLLSVVAVA
jgi:hypothetical protein